MQAIKTPVSVLITTLQFDERGNGERAEYTYTGTLSQNRDTCTLSYGTEGEEGKQETALSFPVDRPNEISLDQTGTVNAHMCFAPGKTYRTLYCVAGVGSMDMEIYTRSAENQEAEYGRRIRLDYEMTVGGVRGRRVMTLTVTYG